MGDSKDIGLRTSGRALNALHGEALEAAKDELAEYINLNGAVLDASPDAPWGAAHRASTLSTSERAAEAVRLLDDLSGRLLPEVEHELAEMAQHLGIDPPATESMTQALLEALARFEPLHGRFAPAAFQAGDVESLLSALEPAERGPLAELSETDLTPWGVTVEELDLRIQALGLLLRPASAYAAIASSGSAATCWRKRWPIWRSTSIVAARSLTYPMLLRGAPLTERHL